MSSDPETTAGGVTVSGGNGDVLDSAQASRALVRGSAGRTLAYVASSFANALVLPFLFRYLGVVRSGQYVTVVSLSTILAGIVETGLTGISLQLYSVQAFGERPQLMRDLLSMRLVVLGTATVLLLAFLAIAGYPLMIVGGFVLCSAGVAFENVGSAYNVWLASNLHLGWIAISNVVRQLLIATLMLTLVALRAPLVWFFVAVIPAGVAQMLVSAAVTRGHSPLGPSGNVRRWWALTRSSATYVCAMALGFVYFRIPLIIMSLLLPGRSTGLFGAAFRLVETLTLMTGLVLTAAVPILARAADRDHLRHRYGVQRVVEVSLILGGAMTVAVATGSKLAIEVLAGPKFEPSVGLLRLLSLVLILKFLTTAWGFGLLSLGSYRPVLRANAFATAASIVVSVLAIPLIGIYGGVIATIAAEFALALAYGWMMRTSLGRAGFPLRTAVTVLGSGLISAAVLLPPIGDIAQPALATVIFALLLLVLRAYPPEALELLPWRRRRAGS